MHHMGFEMRRRDPSQEGVVDDGVCHIQAVGLIKN
jgi:hypothetical protein